jgi:Protein of unknown function (DUF2934)
MARSKSIPGSKTNRAKNNIEQTADGIAANLPDVKAVAETPAQASPVIKATREIKPAPEGKTPAEAKVAAEPKAASEGRKFEVMKTDSRKNVVPINLDEEIRRRAYEIYQQRGSGSGSEAEDWLTAEREIRQRYRQQSA